MKWSAEEIAVIQTSARGLKGELQLNKEYILEGCMHQNENGYFLRLYIYRYSDGPLRLCEWDCEDKSTVSYPCSGGLLLIQFLGLTFASKSNRHHHTDTRQNLSHQSGRVRWLHTATGLLHVARSNFSTPTTLSTSLHILLFLPQNCNSG
jgi:hypothetical protein